MTKPEGAAMPITTKVSRLQGALSSWSGFFGLFRRRRTLILTSRAGVCDA